jgi:TrkA-C domain/Amino acid permease
MRERVGFKRNIGLFMAVMIGIGAMMGPGIFALPGELGRMVGPLGILVYLVMGVVTFSTALKYSELGAAVPVAGSGYSFTGKDDGVASEKCERLRQGAASEDDGRNVITALQAKRIGIILGVIVPEGSRVVGKAISEIAVPRECVVAAIIRGKEFVVPRGDTRIEEGDHVLFVGPATAVQKARDAVVLTT